MTRHILPLLIAILVSKTSCGQSQTELQQMRRINSQQPAPLNIQRANVEANSIRISDSQHLALYTDLRERSDVDEFNIVFDAAVSQWCAYFKIETDRARDWKMRGIVIGDRVRFQNAGLMPSDIPDFPAGFQRGHEMWVYVQPGKYYTRHLLLHEGTHAFMNWFLGGTGAPWYSEGMAELLGLHRWTNNQLEIGYRLKDRKEAEYWGRIKLIKEDGEQNREMSLEDVFNIPGHAFRDVRFYAWSWAACEFFANHPLSKKEFAELKDYAKLDVFRFNNKFNDAISKNRALLERDWRLFIREIDFGYDIEKGALTDANSTGANRFRVSSQHSWQKTNINVVKGNEIIVAGRGRFTVANEDGVPWPCEANGITIEYYRGRPLGQLVAGVLGDDGDITSLLSEETIGLKNKIIAKKSGTLCFRINESPSKLYDNKGSLEVAAKVRKK